MIALDLALTTIRSHGNAAAPPAPLVTAINAEGWSAEYAKPEELPALTFTLPGEMTPDSVPKTFGVRRTGFDASGAATSHVETRVITKRKRRAYPNDAQPETASVALDDYVYATDTIAGAANNSTEISPKPIAAWVMPSRLLVGNSVHWEMVAFHRDFRQNRQVACVRVRANDGTTQTAWQTVSITAISTLIEDANPIEVYAGDLDISALATGAFWLEAEVFPWVGAVASLLRSEDNWVASASPRTFTRRYFHKDAARAATPPLAYVAPGGSDSAGIWSTNPAVAAATPFLTLSGAHAAIMHITRGEPATGGAATGCRFRIAGAVSTGAATAVSNPQGAAGVVIERAPGTARAAAVLAVENSYRPNMTCSIAGLEPHVTFTDLTIQRTLNAASIRGEAAAIMGWQIVNATIIDASGTFGAPYSSSHGSFFGVTFDPTTTNWAWLTELTQEIRIMRGITADVNASKHVQWVLIGSRISRAQDPTTRNAAEGVIVYGNRFLAHSGVGSAMGVSAATAGVTISGVALVQNLIEVTGTGTNTGARISGDNDNGSIVHAVLAHNTIVAFGSQGRANLFYDESTGTNRRQHRLIRVTGNIWNQINTKSDRFYATTSTSEAPYRSGNFAYLNGVGCQGEFVQFCSADGGRIGSSFSQMYPGLGASIGATLTARNDPLFVDYKAVTAGPVAGAGGGDYRLQPASPARGCVAVCGLAFDLGGAARPVGGRDAAGAYA